MALIEAKIKTDAEKCWCVGRNGTFPITEISAWQGSNGCTFIEGYGRSGKNLNGGFCITTEAMDDLAQQWLKVRGLRK